MRCLPLGSALFCCRNPWQGIVIVAIAGSRIALTALGQHLVDQATGTDLRFHDLRHTSATLLLAQGVHPKIVQERLGHADISMTLNRYSHVTPDMQRQAADTLDAVFTKVG
jgi:integrase